MPSPPKTLGRPMTLAGLRVIVLTLAVFQLVWMLLAHFGKQQLGQPDPELGELLVPALLLLAAGEALAFAILRGRFKKRWLAELERRPWREGGPVPMDFAAATIIGAAFAEGLGLFAVLIYLLSASSASLAIAALALLLILVQLPRRDALL